LDLDETWQRDGNGERLTLVFGEIAPGTPEKGAKNYFFYYFVSVTNTTHRFAHFRFTDFNETRQEYVNFGELEPFRSKISRGRFSLQKDFRTPFSPKTFINERHILGMFSTDQWRSKELWFNSK